MAKGKSKSKEIQVCAHWVGLPEPVIMGMLSATIVRGKEIFAFSYDANWLKSSQVQNLDPNLQLFAGPQYPKVEHANFGMFLDSAPDRWGRTLMLRREAQQAREEKRESRAFQESDFLLGVFDGHRMGALRFRLSATDPYLDNNTERASPPWARLRELEHASLELEKDNAEQNRDYMKWLKLLIAPGGSLGGARPKAGVVDEEGSLWIAKFPSRKDELNTGGWEYLVHQLAKNVGIVGSETRVQRFTGKYETFLTKRFDRTNGGGRIHFASAMTLLGKKDGDGGHTGVSYLDLADFIIKKGAQPDKDLEQLWRRIVFNICVSNVDDHLRNHGFLLQHDGWVLSPAYDMNPSETGNGLTLNISKQDNAQSLELVLDVSHFFRIKKSKAVEIISEVLLGIRAWRKLAKKQGMPEREITLMRHAFRVAEAKTA
jgi:serine/threonine-protein kinase HipA